MNPPDMSDDGMAHRDLLEALDADVRALRQAAFRLKASGGGIQALERNLDRILSSIRMLEINVSDLLHEPDSLVSWAPDEAQI